MLQQFSSAFADLLGIGPEQLNATQMSLRALIVYISAIVIIRIGEKRFLGKNTAFDVILAIMLGSVLSRAITGNAPFLPSIVAGLALVAIHWSISVLSFHSDWFGSVVKGKPRVLVRDGEIQWDQMKSSHISEKDLREALFSNARIGEVAQVKLARLERNGDISILKKEQALEIIEVSVHEGVQTIRIERR